MAASQSAGALWRMAAEASWLPPEDRPRLRLRAAEEYAMRGETAAALEVLPDLVELRREDLAGALAVVAQVGGTGSAAAQRRLAIEFPQAFVDLHPEPALASISATFSPAEWAVHAQAWLDAGRPPAALAAAAHARGAGYAVAARALLRLHRSVAAVAWAARGGEQCAECWPERVEGYRQIAWAVTPERRQARFAAMLQAAERARLLLLPGDPAVGRVELLLAEALTELDRFSDALPHLTAEAVKAQPRWEWVCRRWFFLQADGRHPTVSMSVVDVGRSTRGKRLAAFWRARASARQGDRSGLQQLAESGFPDLPAEWAASELGEHGVRLTLSEQPPTVPTPPAWAKDLLGLGRVADVAFAWRTELEAGGGTRADWLGLAALAGMPALDAVPLLVRGEPKLLSGLWQGLPRELLQLYLPLPWRGEVEAAARRAEVPPWVLAGLVRQESAWNPRARSTAGALGLAQVMPEVADEIARDLPGLPRRGDIFDPARNLTLGAALLDRWRRSFGGSWEAALAGYNAGERRVREIWERTGHRGGPEFVEALEIPETWDYVHRIVLLAEGYRILYWPEGRSFPWT